MSMKPIRLLWTKKKFLMGIKKMEIIPELI